jgi:glycosyltransferase involved in cell wall biosynthesis
MYIIDSINSLLNQSYKNIEIIIIDDISTDHTVELVNNYIQENCLRKKIKIYVNERKLGLSASRNVGIRNSVGDYIAFQDPFDFSMRKRFEIQVKDIIKYKLDISCSSIYTTKEINANSYLEDWQNKEILYSEMKNKNKKNKNIGLITLIINKDLFIKYGYFNEDLKYWFDKEIIERLYYLKYDINPTFDVDTKVLFMNNIPNFYRLNTNQLYVIRSNLVENTNRDNDLKLKCMFDWRTGLKLQIEKIRSIKKDIKDNTLYIILACDKYIERYNTLINNLNNLSSEINYIIVKAGNDDISYNSIEKILYVDSIENYESLPQKISRAYEWLYYNTSYKYYYKVDDDFDFSKQIIMDISEYDYFANYIVDQYNPKWHFGKCDSNILNSQKNVSPFITIYGGGGYGYIISRLSLELLTYNIKFFNTSCIYEDKIVGDILYREGITVNNKDNKYKQYNLSNLSNISNKKCAVIFFHKNIRKLYKKSWIDKCVNSILNQKYIDYDIFEINYGNEEYSIFEDIDIKLINNRKIYFYKKDFKIHSYAMNYLLDICFIEKEYDIVFNTNLDDYYHPYRFLEQIVCINNGYLLCSSYWHYFEEIDNNEIPKQLFHNNLIGNDMIDNDDNYCNPDMILNEIENNNNIINHSGVCFTKEFWKSFDKYNNYLRYRDDKPYEDMSLWKRALENNIPITIIKRDLISYRIHANQIGSNKTSDKGNSKLDKFYKNSMDLSKKRIGMIIIGTGIYIYNIQNIIESILDNFLPLYTKKFFITTDNVEFVDEKINIINNKYNTNIEYYINKIYKKGSPLDTLYRYRYILNFEDDLLNMTDIIYYTDIDMHYNDKIGDIVLPNCRKPLVGVLHPGYYIRDTNGTPETNIESTAYIDPDNYNNMYIAGGFNGGLTKTFLDMVNILNNNIEKDKLNDIIALWHDESHINWYFNKHTNLFKILTPKYCYPDILDGDNHYNILFNKISNSKIIALNKSKNWFVENKNKNKIIVNTQGGLGNLLFEIANGLSLSIDNNIEMCIIYNSEDEKRGTVFRHRIFDNIYRIKNINDIKLITINENNYMYNKIENIKSNKNYILNGYFQSLYYFKHNFNKINDILDKYYLDIAKTIFKKLNLEKIITIAVHFRYTDYLEDNYHYNLPEEYYLNILNEIYGEYLDQDVEIKILIFTDDINIFKENNSNIINIYNNILYVNDIIDRQNDETDMFLISLCDYIICANSTFSLWGSYFSDNKTKVYLPDKWFKEDGPKYDITEFVLDSERYFICKS